MNSSHLTPALKTRFSVYLRITLEFVKDIYSIGVGLSLGTVYSPAGYGILMKMISKVCFEKQYFRREVGNWVSNELSSLPVFPSHFQSVSRITFADILHLLFTRISLPREGP